MLTFNKRAALGILEFLKMRYRQAEDGCSYRGFVQLRNNFRYSKSM